MTRDTGSTTPLAAKLGLADDRRGLVVGPVPPTVLAVLPPIRRRAGTEPFDVVIAFCPTHAVVTKYAEDLPERLMRSGRLWLCWPKRSSGVATDTGEADIRATGLATGLVDIKVAAIDETWSGLCFVRRLADR